MGEEQGQELAKAITLVLHLPGGTQKPARCNCRGHERTQPPEQVVLERQVRASHESTMEPSGLGGCSGPRGAAGKDPNHPHRPKRVNRPEQTSWVTQTR